jgi:hypothetical protein
MGLGLGKRLGAREGERRILSLPIDRGRLLFAHIHGLVGGCQIVVMVVRVGKE